MVTGTAIKCGREAETHGGPLRRDGNDWICQECWAKENGIEPRRTSGKQTKCPDCDKVLMTKYRGGKISISNMSMKGSTATLKCDCGYEKTIPNPFGGRPQNRDEVARAKLRREGKVKEAKGASL